MGTSVERRAGLRRKQASSKSVVDFDLNVLEFPSS